MNTIMLRNIGDQQYLSIFTTRWQIVHIHEAFADYSLGELTHETIEKTETSIIYKISNCIDENTINDIIAIMCEEFQLELI